MPFLLRLGNWLALLYACTPDVEAPVKQFGDFSRAFLVHTDDSREEVGYLVIAGPALLGEQAHPAWLSKSEQPVWEGFFRSLVIAYQQFSQTRSSDSLQPIGSEAGSIFSWPRSGYENTNSYCFSPGRERSTQFFALVIEKPGEHSYLRIFGYCLFLALGWHIVQGGLCLHSAAVARGGDGFLFLGRSEAGKTTVTQLSASAGHSALGDDLNFVIRDGERGYRLAAAPSPMLSPVEYSMLRPPLRGVFTLVKDDGDYLVPLSTMQVARALFDSFTQQTPYVRRLPDGLIGLGFRTVCDIARRVPGYELHFRKSPDFWKLIDEQFPD